MSEELTIYETDQGEIKLSPAIVKQYLVSGQGNVTNQEIMLFIRLCQYQKLNPFLREAYLIKYGSAPATMVTGKDVFTKRAAKREEYDGAEAGVFVTDEPGDLTERAGTLILPKETLIGGWAKVFRKDWKNPVYISVNFSEYEGKKQDGSANKVWKKMPATMIRKVALVQALRETFPETFQGMYDAAEMGTEELPGKTIKEPTEVVTAKVEDAPESTKKAEKVAEPTEPPKDKDLAPKNQPDDNSSLSAECEKVADRCRAGVKICNEGNLYEEETEAEAEYVAIVQMYEDRNLDALNQKYIELKEKFKMQK